MKNGLQPGDMNPKAREAFAKSVIDTGVAIFRSSLLITISFPIALLLRTILNADDSEATIHSVFGNVSGGIWFAFGVIVLLGMLLGFYYRDKGVKLLHEMEVQQTPDDI